MQIVSSFEVPFKLANYEVNTTVSVGVCMYPNDGADVDELKVSTIFVDEAMTMKRIRPRAKGRADRILKRTCHITVKVAEV